MKQPGARSPGPGATSGAQRPAPERVMIPYAAVGLLTCPACRQTSEHSIPVNACQFFLECPACGVLLRPRPGDCCVFCSYSDTPCPSCTAGNTDGPVAMR